MKRQPRDHRRRAKALTDPKPEFVSVVKAGANMTPIKVMKSDGLEDQPEAQEVEVAVKADDHEVVRIVFQKSDFPEEATVLSWLEDGGYSDFTLVSKEDSYEVGEIEADREVSEIKIKGASVFVAMKTTEDAARAESTGGAVTLVTPVAKREDGVEEVAAKTEAMEPISEDRRKGIYHVQELANAVCYVKYVCDDLAYEVVYGDEDEQAPRAAALNSVKEAGAALLAALSQLMGVEVTEMAQAFKAAQEADTASKAEEATASIDTVVETPATETADVQKEEAQDEDPAGGAEAGGAVEVEAAAEEAVEAVEETAEKVTDVVESSQEEPTMKQVLHALSSLTDVVKGLTTVTTDLQTATATKSEDLVARVSAIESERQSRKGADVEEVRAEETKKADVSANMDEHRRRSILGMRNTNS